jgi:hypothetical protein
MVDSVPPIFDGLDLVSRHVRAPGRVGDAQVQARRWS